MLPLEGPFEEDGAILDPSDRFFRDRCSDPLLLGEALLLLGPLLRRPALRIFLDLSKKNQLSSGHKTGHCVKQTGSRSVRL